uniref:Uncharacterized protein n=1 Tax=Anguilla anguilla TaxID=7936 RepID=A0A0E9UX49_ANGAN
MKSKNYFWKNLMKPNTLACSHESSQCDCVTGDW